MNAEELNAAFGGDSVRFFKGDGDFIFVEVVNEQARAVISLYGAHVIDFTPAGQEPVLWMSRKSCWAEGKPIRGGIPVCWPYFGPHKVAGAGPAHGYARLHNWNFIGAEKLASGADRLVLALPEGLLPAPYAGLRAGMEIIVGTELSVKLQMENAGSADCTVSCALHSYFAVGDCEKVSVAGLENTEYLDKLTMDHRMQHGAVTIGEEVDRVYLGTAADCVIEDPVKGRRIRISKNGSDSTVVWNPWIAKSQRMPDFGDDEYHTMICVETVNAESDARTLKPGDGHEITARISVL